MYSTSTERIPSDQRELLKWQEGLDLDPEQVLARIHVARAYNSAHQMLLVDEIKRMSKAQCQNDNCRFTYQSLQSRVHWPWHARQQTAETQQAFERTETISRYQQRTSPCYQSGSFQARRNGPYQANWWARFSHASTFRLPLVRPKAAGELPD